MTVALVNVLQIMSGIYAIGAGMARDKDEARNKLLWCIACAVWVLILKGD